MITRTGVAERILSSNPKAENEMGEVRVRVKLTNATDAMLAWKGQIDASAVRSCLVDALVDTGAVRTIVPRDLVEQLGLEAVGTKLAEYADGRREIVDRTEPLFIEIEGRDTFDEALVLGNEVLIGQTVLEKIDMLVDCPNRRLVPNPDHPDRPVSKVK